jgi:hypothetical protein
LRRELIPGKFVKENCFYEQDDHILSEAKEFANAKTIETKIEEAIDLYHSLETYFRMFEDRFDMNAAFEKVRLKNEARGYYKND